MELEAFGGTKEARLFHQLFHVLLSEDGRHLCNKLPTAALNKDL